MAKTKAPFSIQKRPTTKKGKYIYYVQFRDERGNYTSAMSSGQTSKSAAMVWAQEYLKNGPVPTQRGFTFAKYAKDWWIWDKCAYVKGKLARGKTISKLYAEGSRRNLEKHLLPYWGDWKLTNIKPFDVEDWLMDMYENSGLNPATLNRILATFKVMMKEAVRFRYIQEDPTKDIGILKEQPKIKTILSKAEVKALFNEEHIRINWQENLILPCHAVAQLDSLAPLLSIFPATSRSYSSTNRIGTSSPASDALPPSEFTGDNR